MDSVLVLCIVQYHCIIKHNTTQRQLVQCVYNQVGEAEREREIEQQKGRKRQRARLSVFAFDGPAFQAAVA